MQGFRNLCAGLALACSGLAATAADLVDSQVVYSHRQWEVLVAAFDDASISCIARVSKSGSTFAIWADGNSSALLQFWDKSWSFDSGTEDIVVQIDRRAKWDLSNAELSSNSVWFELPNSNDAERFLREVINGNTVKLFNSGGRQINSWSLAGSAASINALIECTDILAEDVDGNPFN